MTTLALAVDADDEMWTLDNLPTPEAPYVEVGTELIEVRSRFPSQTYTLTGETLPPRIRVRRGIAGTTAASHIQGSTLTPNYGLGGGGGGAIAVTGSISGEVTDAASIELAGAVVTGGAGAATAQQQQMIAETGGDSASVTVNANGVGDAEMVVEVIDGTAAGHLTVGSPGHWDATDAAGDSAYIDVAGGNVLIVASEAPTSHTLTVHGADGLLLDDTSFNRAAFVANGSTVDQLRDALIASGLMEAS